MKNNAKNTIRFLIAVNAIWIGLSMSATVSATHFPEPGDPVAGAKLWATTCSRCHNARDPADLRDDQWISTAFHMRVRAGLTGQQTRDVLTFMQNSNVPISVEPLVFKGNTQSGSEASNLSGSEVYAQTCIACHGSNGKGTVPGAPNFTDPQGVLSQSDELLFSRVKNGFKSPGSAMAMPPKGGNNKLNDADIRAVIEYMKKSY